MRNFQASLCAVSSLLMLCSLSACRVKVPTIAEQQALLERGAFPGPVPAWVYRGPGARTNNIEVPDSGYLPASYVQPRIVNGSRHAESAADDRVFQPEVLVQRRALSAGEQSASPTAVPSSPIDRILKACPSIEETTLTDALTTESPEVRLQKYLGLTARCSVSADLWVWVGRDYQLLGKNVEAGRCYDKALVLDGSQADARRLLSEVRDAPRQP